MYQFRHKTKSHKPRRTALYLIGAVVLVALGYLISQVLRPTTSLQQSAAVTSEVVVQKPATKTIQESFFSFTAPADWRLLSHETKPYNVSTWVKTDPKISGRSLKIYVDSTPATLGVNRAMQIQTDGRHMTPIGLVSDNCSTFTKATSNPPSVSTPAIWNGLPFLCDLGNPARDVVGTVSADGLNKVVLNGPKAGKHTFFFTYNEQNIQGDYDIFSKILETFKLN
jgi:hypothetical protein